MDTHKLSLDIQIALARGKADQQGKVNATPPPVTDDGNNHGDINHEQLYRPKDNRER